MPLQLDALLFDTLTSDPGSPVEGQIWFNTTTHLFGMYRNGVATYFTDQVAFLAHVNNTTNPHSTTLEQARTAGNTLAGPINMGGFGITNIAYGTSSTDVAQRQWVSDQIKSFIQGLDFQDPIINETTNTPPASPNVGDRYIVGPTPTGAWANNTLQIAQWNGTTWIFTIPLDGYVCLNLSTNRLRLYTGTVWQAFEQTLTHGSLLALTLDDHPQYVLVSGTRAMSGSLNMGTNAITNCTTIDGMNPLAHATQHNPGGSDAIATAAPSALIAGGTTVTGTASSVSNSGHVHAAPVASAVTITDSTNSTGVSTSFSAADHGHAHGNRSGGSLHALASPTAAGFRPQANVTTTNPTVTNDGTQGYTVGSKWINTSNNSEWVAISVATGAAVWKETTDSATLLQSKSGKVLMATFTGTPKKATVTFTTPFADANYSATVTPVITTSGTLYTPNIESQLAGSFIINMGTGSGLGSLVQVNWSAIKNGESA
jgi:Protein of unknown function (DUF2793)